VLELRPFGLEGSLHVFELIPLTRRLLLIFDPIDCKLVRKLFFTSCENRVRFRPSLCRRGRTAALAYLRKPREIRHPHRRLCVPLHVLGHHPIMHELDLEDIFCAVHRLHKSNNWGSGWRKGE
jgi:hypothetical protein